MNDTIQFNHDLEFAGQRISIELTIDQNQYSIISSKFTHDQPAWLPLTDAIEASIASMDVEKARFLSIEDIKGFCTQIPFPCYPLHLLKAGLNEYVGVESENFDKDIVCRCFGVSASEISDSIKAYDITKVTSLTEKLSAGALCGSCVPDLIEMIIEQFGDQLKSQFFPEKVSPAEIVLGAERVFSHFEHGTRKIEILGVKNKTILLKVIESEDLANFVVRMEYFLPEGFSFSF
ncbi:MAG: (2Fe-2S)-binding protein [Bacteriovoracaceae bacterium]|jgi:bacterioferritin-associated ferredoxin|nr:(2Fe-2S)-binding protein [Bacteriovoracaceae bacterium]